MENDLTNKTSTSKSEQVVHKDEPFKKPILIGKVGHFPKKVSHQKNSAPEKVQNETDKEIISEELNIGVLQDDFEENLEKCENPVGKTCQSTLSLAYKEPVWSGLPQTLDKVYSFEVLKNGSIIEVINLMDRPFWIFGRLNNCHIYMQHPTISRYHAVIQYRVEKSETEEPGFYIYDLGSTHGTFLNKSRLKPKVYTRVQVGHMLKFGCSTRSYILNGPEYDEEEESELTVTELKQKRAEEIAKLEQAAIESSRKEEERKQKEEERGVDWGLGEDADEESDLSENPFAQTNNEELYLEDPKKALRGFFEREGVDLEYDCTEQGMGQFLCKVELPLDDELGRPIMAEVLHKGKKKEAVVQCALEACRILDRYGVLRQATHESRKRKSRNWEENDYYDSDDDTFLDRTGTIEKKREKRMNAKQPQKIETYESLLEREKIIIQSMTELENQLVKAQAKNEKHNMQNSEEDSLDTFMKELTDFKSDKQAISKIKLDLNNLKIEHSKIIKMLNITRPANLPPLMDCGSTPSTSKDIKNTGFPTIGKRKKIKVHLPSMSTTDTRMTTIDSEEDKEEEEEENNEYKGEQDKDDKYHDCIIENITENPDNSEKENQSNDNVNENENNSEINSPLNRNEDIIESFNDVSSASSSSSSDENIQGVSDFSSIKSFHSTMTFKKFEKLLKKGLPPFADKHQDKLQKILNNLKKLAANEDRMHVDWKMLTAKKRKVMKLIADLRTCEPNEKLEHKVSSELNRILHELNTMTEQKYKVIDKVKKMGNEIKSISAAIDKDFEEYKKGMNSKSSEDKPCSSIPFSVIPEVKMSDSELESSESNEMNEEKKRKKNQRRITQRQERAELERQRGYEEDASREGYNMWVPPNDQTGDGRTVLNDKFGY